MKTITVLLVILLSLPIHAQVGIGTSHPATGTSLHIEDSTGTSGVLFPKVNILDLQTVDPLPTGTENGTIVYNTNLTTGEGYYYFKDGKWEPIFGVVGSMAKFTNLLFSTSSNNLNTGGWTTTQLCTSTYFNDNATVYQESGHTTLTVGQTGRYKVVVNISLEGFSGNNNQALLAVESTLRINGTQTGGIYRSQEMISANSSTPDYSSISITEIIELNAMDKITVVTRRTQDTGTVYLRSERSSSIFIERLD